MCRWPGELSNLDNLLLPCCRIQEFKSLLPWTLLPTPFCPMAAAPVASTVCIWLISHGENVSKKRNRVDCPFSDVNYPIDHYGPSQQRLSYIMGALLVEATSEYAVGDVLAPLDDITTFCANTKMNSIS